jgi:ketosteroid isomerase-like protein
MGAKENADLVRRGYAAFSAGDMATLRVNRMLVRAI